MTSTNIQRGEIWLVDLNPTRGHEQSGVRPGLVVSVDEFNNCPAELVVVLPVTTKEKRIPFPVRVAPAESGLRVPSGVCIPSGRQVK